MDKYIQYFEYGKLFLREGTSDFRVLASSDPSFDGSKVHSIIGEVGRKDNDYIRYFGERSIGLVRYRDEYILVHSQFRREGELAKKLGLEPRIHRSFWQTVYIILDKSEIEEYFKNGVSPYKTLIDLTSDPLKVTSGEGGLKDYQLEDNRDQRIIQIEYPSIQSLQRGSEENLSQGAIEILKSIESHRITPSPIEVNYKPDHDLSWQESLSIFEQVQLSSFRRNGILTFAINSSFNNKFINIQFGIISKNPSPHNEMQTRILDLKNKLFKLKEIREKIQPLQKVHVEEQILHLAKISNKDLRLNILANLVNYFEGEIESLGYEAQEGNKSSSVSQISEENDISYLQEEITDLILVTISKEGKEEIRAKALVDVTPYIDRKYQFKILDIISKFHDQVIQAETFEDIYLLLHRDWHQYAIEIIDQIKITEIHDRLLEKLIGRRIEDPLLLLFALSKIRDQKYQDFIIKEIVRSRISNEHLQSQIQKGIREISNEVSQIEILLLLAKISTNRKETKSALGLAHDIAFDIIQRRIPISSSERARRLINIIEAEIRNTRQEELKGQESQESTSNFNEFVPSLKPKSKPIVENEQIVQEKSYSKIPKSSPIAPTKSPSQKRTEEVSFTSYHPKEGKVDTWLPLFVYVYKTSMFEEIQKDVKRFEDQLGLSKETSIRSSRGLKRGAELTIIPSCDGITFNPPQVSFDWMEDFQRAEFRFTADKSLSNDAAKGEVSVYMGPLIIGTLKFAMLFSDKPTMAIFDTEHTKMYGKDDVFISYSRRDTEIARTFKKVLEATGYDVFLDIDDIRSGQLWKKEIYRRIERAKIFQIFWSSNYKRSINCRREWKHAIKQKKDEGYIRPVFWKTPKLAPNPPKELSKFNFRHIEIPTTSHSSINIMDLLNKRFITLVTLSILTGCIAFTLMYLLYFLPYFK